jgi:CDP-glucose 4,6-dehydratase
MDEESRMEIMERLTHTILVTGGTGFVGAHLVEALVKQGNRVIVTQRAADPASYFFQKKLDKKVVLAICDISDFERVKNVITRYEVDTICHLGAQAIVTTALSNPREAIETNVMGTVNILEAARVYPRVKRIIVASSDKAYGKSKKEYLESDPLAGDHPYEVSKSATDLIAQMYVKTYQLPVVITRFGNIYGPGDLNFNRIIPGIIHSIISKEKLRIRSDGTFVRDYVYVGDVVSGYTFLLDHFEKAQGGAYNLSSNDSMSVISLIKMSQKILKKKIRFEIENTQVNEIPYQRLSFDKIKKLGWKPRYTFQKGLTLTYKWYKKNR